MIMPTYDELMEEIFKRHGDAFNAWADGGADPLIESNVQLHNATNEVLLYLLVREMKLHMDKEQEFLRNMLAGVRVMPVGPKQ